MLFVVSQLVPTFRNPRYLALLVLVATLILVVGALTRPQNEAAPPASDADLARLSRLAERRSLDNMTSFFGTIATTAEASLVRLPDVTASGVVWDAGRIVSARMADPFPAEVNVMTGGGAVRTPVTVRRPDLPVVAMAATLEGTAVPPRRAASLVRPEEWVLAVWTAEDTRSYVHGNALDVREMSCDERTMREIVPSFALTRSMAGGGLFDIDGNLIAVILPCGDRLAAIDTAAVDALLGAAATMDAFERGLLAQDGMRVGAITDAERVYFTPADLVVVREVWSGYPAADRGVRPGDIIRSVDDTPVTSLADLQPLASGTATRLRIRRGAATVQIAWGSAPPTPASPDTTAPPAAPALSTERPAATVPGGGVTLGAAEGYRIDGVAAGSAAAAAGVQVGDRLIRINQTAPASTDQVRRLLDGTRTRPAFIEVERGRRRFGVVIK